MSSNHPSKSEFWYDISATWTLKQQLPEVFFSLDDFLDVCIYCHNKSHYEVGKDFPWNELAKNDKLEIWDLLCLQSTKTHYEYIYFIKRCIWKSLLHQQSKGTPNALSSCGNLQQSLAFSTFFLFRKAGLASRLLTFNCHSSIHKIPLGWWSILSLHVYCRAALHWTYGKVSHTFCLMPYNP